MITMSQKSSWVCFIDGGVNIGECSSEFAVNVPAFSLGDQIYLFYIEF